MGHISSLQESGILSVCLFDRFTAHAAAPSCSRTIQLTLSLVGPSQIFADFQEIRREIEAETERTSGDNKVKGSSPN